MLVYLRYRYASVSQEQIFKDIHTCCHTETEGADQTCNLTKSRYTDTWPTCPVEFQVFGRVSTREAMKSVV